MIAIVILALVIAEVVIGKQIPLGIWLTNLCQIIYRRREIIHFHQVIHHFEITQLTTDSLPLIEALPGSISY